ncbi:DUF6518 family protein [Streptomyces sp. NPDC055092]
MRSLPLSITIAVVVGVGVIVGVGGPLFLSTGGEASLVASVVLSAGWSYAALAFGVGMLEATSKARAAVLGTVSLIVAVLAYYLVKAWQGDYETADLSDTTGQTTTFAFGEFLSATVVWWVVASITGPILGLSGHLARKSRFRVVFQVVVPVVAIAEMSMRIQSEASRQDSIVVTTWGVIRGMAIVAVVSLVGYALFDAWRRGSARQLQR